jgi:hypothetical protein
MLQVLKGVASTGGQETHTHTHTHTQTSVMCTHCRSVDSIFNKPLLQEEHLSLCLFGKLGASFGDVLGHDVL